MKVVINTCYGGFDLSEQGVERYYELVGPGVIFDEGSIKRNDPALVQVVEELGEDSWGEYAQLSIVDIEPGTWYRIAAYDGWEFIEYRDDDETWLLAE